MITIKKVEWKITLTAHSLDDIENLLRQVRMMKELKP